MGDEAVGDEAARIEGVRGEAGRLAARLGVAVERLDAARTPRAPGAGGAGGARIDDVDDDEVRPLLGPAVDRIAQLAQAARGVADGTLTEEAAATAVLGVRDSQPTRRPR